MASAERERSHDPRFPETLMQFMSTGWSASTLQVAPLPHVANLASRRQTLSGAFPGETLVIPAGPELTRSNSTVYHFRPGSDFARLSGDHDPDGVLVMHPSGEGHEAVLYARGRSCRETSEFFRDARHGELWVGRRHSLAEKSLSLGLQTAELSRLAGVLERLDAGRTRVVRGIDAGLDRAVPVTGEGEGDREFAAVLAEMKLVKDDWEIAQLRDAVAATLRGFEDAVRAVPADRPVPERLVDGAFWSRARQDGNYVGYLPIVAGGHHATTLHWVRNDGVIRPGELLLMDMAVENEHLYTADITRTVPVSGRFTPLQREVYDIVHAAQQAGIAAIRPGVLFDDVHQICMRVLAEGLHGLGVLPVGVDEAMDKNCMLYWRWTLHNFGHMLGIDVHDCARARADRYRDGVLGQDYVLTVEPGLYFQPDDELVPAELRGIGIRIEDDVRVTATGAEVLSAALPGQADELEAWLAAQRETGR